MQKERVFGGAKRLGRIESAAVAFRGFLNHPQKVILLCGFGFFLSVFLDGGLFRLWGLHRDIAQMNRFIDETREQTEALNQQLKQARDPSFIERQARDKLDMVNENDLVFVFSDGPQ